MAVCKVGISLKTFGNRLAAPLRIRSSMSHPLSGLLICAPNFVFVLCLLPHVGCPEEIPDGTQEQRGESGEVPG